MLETELIFRSFNERYLQKLTLQQLQLYNSLLQRDEPDIWNWLSGRTPVPSDIDNEIFRMIKSHMNEFIAKSTQKPPQN
jgi:antitoxin CptB